MIKIIQLWHKELKIQKNQTQGMDIWITKEQGSTIWGTERYFLIEVDGRFVLASCYQWKHFIITSDNGEILYIHGWEIAPISTCYPRVRYYIIVLRKYT